jgi:hypothetical protein
VALLSGGGSLTNKAVTRCLRDAGSFDSVDGDDTSRVDGQESDGLRNDTDSEGASRASPKKAVRQDSRESRTEGKGIRATSEGGTVEAQGFEPTPSLQTCKRLMTVPGVGPLVALTYVAGIDDPARFSDSRTVAAHFGLTPRRFQSGEMDWSGGISRAGDAGVRRALLPPAANVLIYHSRGWCALKCK